MDHGTWCNVTFMCLSFFHTSPPTSPVPGPVSSVTYNITNTSAVISWKEPDVPNGVITGYTLYYYKTARNMEGNSINILVKRETAYKFSIISDLSKFTY